MKFGAWIVMIVMLILGLSIFGIPSMATDILNYVGVTHTQDSGVKLSTVSSLWTALFSTGTGILVLLGGAALVIGLFGRGYDPSIIYASIVVTLVGVFGVAFGQIYLSIYDILGVEYLWLSTIIGFVFAGLMVGFIMSSIDYFGGRTN